MHKSFFIFLFTISGCYMVLSADAHAYLDPGTGSILLQAIAAGVIAIGGVWYAFKEKIRSFFGKNKENITDIDKDSTSE